MNEILEFDGPSQVDPGLRRIRFSARQIPLAEELSRLVAERKFAPDGVALDQLHRCVSREHQVVDGDGFNNVTKSFYETSEEFVRLYRQIIADVLKSDFGFDFLFQATPTIRFHFPGSMPDAYRVDDRNFLGHHNDGMLGHSHEEINCWLPLTDCAGSAALQLVPLAESIGILNSFAASFGFDHDTYHRTGRGLFLARLMSDEAFRKQVLDHCRPVEMAYGELLVFDSRTIHSTADNRENATRVSLDFRIMQLERYDALEGVYVSQGRSKRKFIRGDVFHAATAHELARQIA